MKALKSALVMIGYFFISISFGIIAIIGLAVFMSAFLQEHHSS